jgi:hypothetical protein
VRRLLFALRENFVIIQMVHNISLDKSSQSTFTKAVKNIKALIKVSAFELQ